MLPLKTSRRRLLLLALMIPWCIFTNAQARYAVQVEPTRLTSWESHITALGEVRSHAQVTLYAPVGGRLRGPFIAEGLRVKPGQILASIAPPGLDSHIAAARQRLSLAQALLSHTRALFHARLDTRSDLQQAATRVASAKDTLAALREERREVRLTAPLAGNVHYLVPPGTAVLAGTALVHLEGAGRAWIRTYVSPATAQQLRIGKVATFIRGGLPERGRIASIGDSARHDGLVEVIIRPQKDGLLPGEWLRLSLPGACGRAFELPRTALVMRGLHTEVFVVQQGHAQALAVKVVYLGHHHVWVKGQLHNKEVVIIRGADAVTSGTAVKARMPDA